MNREEFIEEIKKFATSKVKIKHVPGSNYISVLKKNTFKIEVFLGHTEFRPSIVIYKRTKFGGYKEWGRSHGHDCGTMFVLDKITNCISWPEVGKTEDRFDRDQLLPNIIAREILKHLKGMGDKAKINRLATDENEECVITSWIFRMCRVSTKRTLIEWKHPCNISKGGEFEYNMMDPSFDPDLLVKSVIRFARELKHLAEDIGRAWGEIENHWHLEKRNHESK